MGFRLDDSLTVLTGAPARARPEFDESHHPRGTALASVSCANAAWRTIPLIGKLVVSQGGAVMIE
ncbi:MAG: hypothetical protein WAV52_12960, partial [Luteococcus japonicus]